MKLTFSDQIALAQELSGLSDAASTAKFKRDINIGASLFLAKLGREYNRHSRFTNMVANQQYYQLPEDGQKLKEIIVNTGNWFIPLEQVADEFAWRMMNMSGTTGQPTHYFIRGNDEVGLYPKPSSSVSSGIELVFSPKHVQLTEADYTTGTITVTNGSQAVTGSSTVFTANMVGRWLQVTDGTDENFYRVSAFTSSTSITLENYYQGTSGSGKAYRIGQVCDMPEEFLESPVDYCLFMFHKKRGSREAADFKNMFDSAVLAAKDLYGSTTDSQVISAEPVWRTWNNWRGDDPGTLTS
jgi:hypothetical protein